MLNRNKIVRNWKLGGLRKSFLTFTAAENNCTVQMYSVGMPNEIFLEYTTNGVTWQAYNFTTTEVGETTEHREGAVITLYEIGDFVQFRARKHSVDGTVIDYNPAWTIFGNGDAAEPTAYYMWQFSDDVYASGNIQSLKNHNGKAIYADAGAFFKMFYECTHLLTAPYLGASTIYAYSYMQMFSKSGIKSVEFYAGTIQTVNTNQFTAMFSGCTNLVNVGDIKIKQTTYEGVSFKTTFYGCTSLVKAPNINMLSSTVSNSGWQSTFRGCTALTDISGVVPAMNKTSLTEIYANNSWTFEGCTALEKVENISFPFFGNEDATGVKGRQMFANCPSLKEVDMVNRAERAWYYEWFKNDSSLSKIVLRGLKGWGDLIINNYQRLPYHKFLPILNALGNGTFSFTSKQMESTGEWVDGVASDGDFFCEEDMPEIRGKSFIPEKWKVHRIKFNDWLCFTAEKANSTIQLNRAGSPDPVRLETSTDGSTWTEYTWAGNTGAPIMLANVGDKVYWRAVDKNKIQGFTSNNYYSFSGNGSYVISGDIRSLVDKFCAETDLTYIINQLFRVVCNITDFKLPVNILSFRLLNYTFSYFGVSGVADLWKIETITGVYSLCRTFQNSRITSLYLGIKDWNNIKYTCWHMNDGCSRLSYIKVRFKSWAESLDVTTDWVKNVATNGTFVCHPDLDIQHDDSHVPVGWTVKTFAQDACDTYSDIATLVQAYHALADVINDHPDIVEKLHQYNGLVHSLVDTGQRPYMIAHGDIWETDIFAVNGSSASLEYEQVNANDCVGFGCCDTYNDAWLHYNCLMFEHVIDNNTYDDPKKSWSGTFFMWGGGGDGYVPLKHNYNTTNYTPAPIAIGKHTVTLGKANRHFNSIAIDGNTNTGGQQSVGTYFHEMKRKFPIYINGVRRVGGNNATKADTFNRFFQSDAKYYRIKVYNWENLVGDVVPIADGVFANIADLDNIKIYVSEFSHSDIFGSGVESRSSVFGLEQITA